MSKKIEDGLTPQERYNKKNVKKFYLDLNLNTDSDIIALLESQPNKQKFLKDLLRKELNEKGTR